MQWKSTGRSLSEYGLHGVLGSRSQPAHHRLIFKGAKRICCATARCIGSNHYPGFNMRMAGFAKANGIKVAYYIASGVGVEKNRVLSQEDRRRAVSILPFEKSFAGFGMQVPYVGHPCWMPLRKRATGLSRPRPDSWKVRPSLHFFRQPAGGRSRTSSNAERAEGLPEYRGKWLRPSTCGGSVSAGWNGCRLVADKTYPLLSVAHAALVTSGTATLGCSVRCAGGGVL